MRHSSKKGFCPHAPEQGRVGYFLPEKLDVHIHMPGARKSENVFEIRRDEAIPDDRMQEDESGSKAYAEKDEKHHDPYPGEIADFSPEFKKESPGIRSERLDEDDEFGLEHDLCP